MALSQASSSRNSKRLTRWEIFDVKHVEVKVSAREWRSLLETVAEELYQLSHQLQEGTEARASGAEPDSSISIHPSQSLETLTPEASALGDHGAWNGTNHKHAA